MREILFKAIRKDNGKWVEGSLLLYANGDAFIVQPIFKCLLLLKRTFPVHWETVCEYTGEDDKNGKRIFEGDILSCGNCRGAVLFARCGFGFVCIEGGSHPRSESWKQFKIIGNIHDREDKADGAS